MLPNGGMMDMEAQKYRDTLAELIESIDRRWSGESDKKRANAISPRMEEAIAAARKLLEEGGRVREKLK
jgi:hypothetical protein